MKLRLPKLRGQRSSRKIKSTFRSLGTIVILSVVTAVLFSVVFLALPKTELVSSLTRYDLRVKNNDWKNIYRVVTSEQDANKLENMRNVFATRLEKYGIERFTVSQPMDQGDSTNMIQISVQSDKDAFVVSSLLKDDGQIELLLPKTEVDFTTSTTTNEDGTTTTNDPSTDENNYTKTEFNRSFFRNIDVKFTTLTDSTGAKQEAYIGIFKTWVADSTKFKDFLNNNLGKKIGMKINGQVGARTIQTSDATTFFIQLGTTDAEAQYYDIIFNSGVIDFQFTQLAEENSTPSTYQVDYEKAAIAFTIAMLLCSIFIFIKQRSLKASVLFLLSSAIILSVYIGYYKLSLERIELYFICIAGLLTMMLNLVIALNTGKIKLVIACYSALFVIGCALSLGIVSWLARDMLLVCLAIVPVSYLTNLYLDKLSRALLR